MGIRPVPPDVPYGARDCSACFAAGRTPREMKAWFNGLELCPEAEWPPEPLPNFFILEQDPDNSCSWIGGNLDNWNVIYAAHTGGGASLLNLRYQYNPGFGAVGSDCQKSFENAGACPYNLFEGGAGIIIPSAGTTGLSLQTIAEAAGFPIDMETKMDIIAIDEDFFAAHFFRKGLCRDALIKFAIADF